MFRFRFRFISITTLALVCFGAVWAVACEDTGWNYDHYVLFKHYESDQVVEWSMLIPTLPPEVLRRRPWDSRLYNEKAVMVIPRLLAAG